MIGYAVRFFASKHCGHIDSRRDIRRRDEPLKVATSRQNCVNGRRNTFKADPQPGVAAEGSAAAICVQGVDVQGVLQFTLIHAVGCALHRRTSRVIHRLEWFFSTTCQKVAVLLGRPSSDQLFQ